MKFKCLNCGWSVELDKRSLQVSVGPLVLGEAIKTETSKFTGFCPRCGTKFYITAEQESILEDSKKEGE